MLFSDQGVASTMNNQFECAWQELRPVPQVHIDFGDGNELRRTLAGNVATWIVSADGRAIDVIPALYSKLGYIQRLTDARTLFTKWLATHASERDALVRGYHRAKSTDKAERIVARPTLLKPTIEDRIKQGLMAREEGYNRKQRATKAHALLAQASEVEASALTDAFFRSVLGVDLKDPYLGLAPYLIGSEKGRMRNGRAVDAKSSAARMRNTPAYYLSLPHGHFKPTAVQTIVR